MSVHPNCFLSQQPYLQPRSYWRFELFKDTHACSHLVGGGKQLGLVEYRGDKDTGEAKRLPFNILPLVTYTLMHALSL
jgi:hypothetical protein